MTVKLKDRQDWLAFRTKGIGASDAAAALGLNPYKTPFQLWAEKTGRAPAPADTEPAKWGRKLERVIAEAFEEETGRVVHDPGPYTIYQHPENPILMATPDYFWTVPEQHGLLEVKTAGAHFASQWEEAPPLHYIVQVQFQMLCTAEVVGSIAALIGGQKFVWKDIPRDEEFIDRMRYHIEQFWRDHIEAEMPPVPGALDNSLLGKIVPQKTMDLIPVGAEFFEVDDRRESAVERAKQALDEVDEVEAKIKHAIGEHGGIVLPNGTQYTWLTQHRKQHIVKASEFRRLRRKTA